MEEQAKSNKVKRVRPETLEFIILYNQLRGKAFKGNSELAEVLGFNSIASITEIIKSRQNIDPDKLRIFKERYREFLNIKRQFSPNAYTRNCCMPTFLNDGFDMVYPNAAVRSLK